MLGQLTATASVGSTGKPRMETDDCGIVLEELSDFVRKDRHLMSFDIRRISSGKMSPPSNITGN